MLLLLLAPFAYGKGSPDLIVLSGHGLTQPVEVNDVKAIEPFSPFRAAFIDWQKSIVQTPVCAAEYEAQIFMKRRPWWSPTHSPYNRGDLEMLYGFRYCEDPHGGPGYILLPDRDDKYGAENRRTILRDGHDGHWHYATQAWRAFVAQAVGRQAGAGNLNSTARSIPKR